MSFTNWLKSLFGSKAPPDGIFGPETDASPTDLSSTVAEPSLTLSKGTVTANPTLGTARKRGDTLPTSLRPGAEDWERIRRQVFERDGWFCQVTGCVNADAHLECHHVTPVATGGSHEIDNLTTLCLFHHSCQKDHDVVSMKERADTDRYWIKPGHWRKGRWIKCSFGRKKLVSIQDLKRARSIYHLRCPCDSTDWTGYLRPRRGELIVLCPECRQGQKIPLGVREETCVALAHVLVPMKQGDISLDSFKSNVAGLRVETAPIKACPYCFIEDRPRKCGFLIPQRGPYGTFLRCINFSDPAIQCRYTENIRTVSGSI